MMKIAFLVHLELSLVSSIYATSSGITNTALANSVDVVGLDVGAAAGAASVDPSPAANDKEPTPCSNDNHHRRDLQGVISCDINAAYHPDYSLPWNRGKCILIATCNSPGYNTELECCKAAYAGQTDNYCISQLANPPTLQPTKVGGPDIYYPDYTLAWPEGKCINTAPVPSGWPTFTSMLACCKGAYNGQMSMACIQALPTPPTTAPTKLGQSGAGVYYPDYSLPWSEGKCIDKLPLPSGRPTFTTGLDCCKGAYGGQMSMACVKALPNPPTLSPTKENPTDWYPDYRLAWPDGKCINTIPVPGGRTTYATPLGCCQAAYTGQMSRACITAAASLSSTIKPSTNTPSTLAPSTAEPSSPPSTWAPTSNPTLSPTTLSPTTIPTTARSHAPTTVNPSIAPTTAPSNIPTTTNPSIAPTTIAQSNTPTTAKPSIAPTTAAPSNTPTTLKPSISPTSTAPSNIPSTAKPTIAPSNASTNTCFPNKSTLQSAINTYITNGCTLNTASSQCINLRNTWGWPIGHWCTSLITDMSYLFLSHPTFNEDISRWNVGSVTNMYGMFSGASLFNQDISAWDVSSVTSMTSMFQSAYVFNQNITFWNVGSTTDMMYMFNGASAFNQDISVWNVSAVTQMTYMFREASVFNQNLCAWRNRIPHIANNGIFFLSGCTYKTTPSTSTGPFCAVQTCPST